CALAGLPMGRAKARALTVMATSTGNRRLRTIVLCSLTPRRTAYHSTCKPTWSRPVKSFAAGPSTEKVKAERWLSPAIALEVHARLANSPTRGGAGGSGGWSAGVGASDAPRGLRPAKLLSDSRFASQPVAPLAHIGPSSHPRRGEAPPGALSVPDAHEPRRSRRRCPPAARLTRRPD